MLRLLESLPRSIRCAVACPVDGPLAAALDERGIERLVIPGTAVSFRMHPATTARGLADLARSAGRLVALARRWRADVIHANGVRAGLLATAAARLGGPALVVQVHDHLPAGPFGRAVRAVLARGADRVVAVSAATARNFDEGLGRAVATAVSISIDHERFRPGSTDDLATRDLLGVPREAPLLGEVAQITPWKGQIVAIEALQGVQRRHPDARLLLVGHVAFARKGVRYDNAGYERDLHRRVEELGLQGSVLFVGQRSDVPAVMSALDLLLLPSWEEPFGTVALEAMAMGTVPLVGDVGGVAEYVEDGTAGRVLPPREADRWAEAASELLDDPARRAAMGRRAQEIAARFTDTAYADGCRREYERALAARGRPPRASDPA